MEIGALIWIGSWIATIIISSKKGEGCLAVFTGFLFGPIALIFAILSTGNRIKCPFCQELMDKKAIVCPHCHSQIPIIQNIPNPNATNYSDQQIISELEEREKSATKKAIFWTVIIGLFVVLFILMYRSSNTSPTASIRHQNSAIENFIAEYGEPDEIYSSENELPKPVIPIKRLSYKKANVIITYYFTNGTWKMMGAQNYKNKRVLNLSESLERIKARR